MKTTKTKKLQMFLLMLGASFLLTAFGTQTAAAQAGRCLSASFAAPRSFDAGAYPTSVTVGDFNSDRKLDLAVNSPGSISVLLGDGTGGFAPTRKFYAVNGPPSSVTSGDFNSDGKLDLATSSPAYSNITLLLGDGAGGFSAPTSFDVVGSGDGIVTGDFNSDGKLDLATADLNSQKVSVLLNNCRANTAPVATNDSYNINENAAFNAPAPGVLANDTDADGHHLIAQLVTLPANAANFTLNATAGSFSYTPKANFYGVDSFTYKVSDGSLESNTATVTITVNPVNDAPMISSGGSVTRAQNAAGAAAQIAVVSDVETAAGSLNVTVKSAPTGIFVTNITNNNGSVSATVAAAGGAALGANTVVLQVSDGDLTRMANLTVNVTPSKAAVITLKPFVTLAPPNHDYRTLTVNQMVQSATDDCDGNILGSVVVERATSDETENDDGDGNTANDIVIGADCRSIRLRAERSGTGNGRVYTVTLKATDSSGNVTRANYKVFVPIGNQTAVDSGVRYSVNSGCL